MSVPDRRPRRWSGRTTRALTLVAFVWTVTASLYLAFAPAVVMTASEVSTGGPSRTGSGVSTPSESADPSRSVESVTRDGPTLLEQEGPSVLIVLAVPVALGLVGAWPWSARRARRARATAGVILLVGVLLGLASVGLPYLPAAVLLLVAGLKTSRAHDVDRQPSPALGR